MKTTHIKHMISRLMAIMTLLSGICLTSCEEITDELYTDMEMVIPAETLNFKVKALKLEEYTLVSITDIVFRQNLQPLGIEVEEARIYIDGELLTRFSVPDPYSSQNFEYKLMNMEDPKHTLRIEYDLSGEGFIPATGVTEKSLNINNLSQPSLFVDMLTFDDKTFVEVDTLKFYTSDYDDLTIKETRYYINEKLIGTDNEAPFHFRGFTDKIDYGEHQITVRFDVATPNGIMATHKVEQPVKADTLYNKYIGVDAFSFDENTYLKVDTLDFYALNRMNLSICETKYYVDGQLIQSITNEPFCFAGLIPALSDGEHTLKIIYNVMDETGEKASGTTVQTFKTSKNIQYISNNALNFDDKCYLKVDDIDIPYDFGNLGVNVNEIRFYIDDELIGTDNEAPYNYQGFINVLDNAEHTLKIVYDVITYEGEKTSNTFTTAVRLHTQSDYLNTDAFHFNEKTYIQVDDVSLPYQLSSMDLNFKEMRFYIDDQLISTDKEEPYACDRLVDLLSGDTHTTKVVYDVTAPDGTVASWTRTQTLDIHENNVYMYTESPNTENGNIFKMNDLSFSWEIYKCQLEVTEANYFIDDQLVKTIVMAPFTFEIENASYTQGMHNLRIVYKVKDTTGTTATWQDESSFYVTSE